MWDIWAEAISTLCFRAPLDPPEVEVTATDELIQVWLPFVPVQGEGPFGDGGALCLGMEPALASAIVSDMLAGEDPSDSDRIDGLGEVANVLCGRAIERFTPAPYDLGSPTKLAGPLPFPLSPERRALCRYRFDEGVCEVSLFASQGSSTSTEG
ncbi:MAG: chemotaxis protein CheX [Myxococcota bacterium]